MTSLANLARHPGDDDDPPPDVLLRSISTNDPEFTADVAINSNYHQAESKLSQRRLQIAEGEEQEGQDSNFSSFFSERKGQAADPETNEYDNPNQSICVLS